ncbi:MAG TPA: hypothetical protein VIF62_14495 [Labilithrix sp.]|jgi:hypothetical protein
MHRNRLLSALAFGSATLFVCSFAAAADPPAKKDSPKKPDKAKTAEPAPDPTPAQPTSTTTTTSAEATPPKDAEKDKQPKKDDDDEDKPISIAGVFGTVGQGLGYGVGVRAGYTLPMHVYVGGYAAYHFGQEVLGEKVTYIYPGVEAGYDIRLKPVTLRPFVGAGVIFANASGPVSGAGNTPALWPGLALVGDIPKSPVFFGLDARLLYLTKPADTALAAQLAAGVKL